MENKNIQSQELELIEKLLDLVNSKEEFDYLMADKARLFSYNYYYKGGARKW